MTADTQPTVTELVAHLQLLADQLKHAPPGKERRTLLKEFRAWLQKADDATKEPPASPWKSGNP